LADSASSISVASGKTVTGSGQFTGTGGLTKNGLGTLSLTAANNFSGPVAVQSGLLNLNASSGAAAASISSVSVASGATLLLSRSDQVNNGATVSLSGGTIRPPSSTTVRPTMRAPSVSAPTPRVRSSPCKTSCPATNCSSATRFPRRI
jgi:autotransporter-associated beta strand protein